MIAYELPLLHCECGFLMYRLPQAEQPRIGGRVLHRCGNDACRHKGRTFAFRPVEHRMEAAE